jgi:NADH-ubiquinone oxidoreductase chain 3
LIIPIIIIILFLALLLFLLGNILGLKSFSDREKYSPFECGFSPKTISRLPFSIRFFLVAIIFLIFDVELILIFPILPSVIISNLMITLARGGVILVILILGLAHEIFQGRLSWAK